MYANYTDLQKWKYVFDKFPMEEVCLICKPIIKNSASLLKENIGYTK